MIEIVGLRGIDEVAQGDNLVDLLKTSLDRQHLTVRTGDIIVVTSKIVSKAEGRFVRLDAQSPSPEAVRLAELTLKDPRLVELVLRESISVVRAAQNVLITRHRLGFVMANAGIDASNIGAGHAGQVLLLPSDPDGAAARMASAFDAPRPAIVISDSFGRPWRMGVVNVAIGASGLPALVDRRGEFDRDGRRLEVTQIAFGDLIASAAGLAAGEGAEGVPAVLVRNCPMPTGESPAGALMRPSDQDLFQ
jgi:coenzyme F420-0:L-glutamate ligase/coenzyme F420-1:gamma-L-glutamate ligase